MTEDRTEWRRPPYRVGLDEIGPYTVSTVKLPFDHALPGDTPQIYETMIFENGEGEADLPDSCVRYAMWEEAVAGHAATVDRVRALAEKGDQDDRG